MAEGLAREGWDKDLRFGEARETAFVQALTNCHVECKSDQKLRAYGNVAFEVRQGSTLLGRGRPSGISTTLSNWWAVEYDDDCWLVMRTSLAKARVRLAANDRRNRKMGGDGGRFELVLVPVGWLVAPWKEAA